MMAKKQWETVMLSKETKERLKDLKGQQSYELFINGLLANRNSTSSLIDVNDLIREHLEPISEYIRKQSPEEIHKQQMEEVIQMYNEVGEMLEKAQKRINILQQENDRLKKRR